MLAMIENILTHPRKKLLYNEKMCKLKNLYHIVYNTTLKYAHKKCNPGRDKLLVKLDKPLQTDNL